MPNSDPVVQTPAVSGSPQPRSRKRRRLRVLLWTIASLATAIIVALCVGALWLRSASKAALPVLDGDLHVAGLSAPVMVRRDTHGVPHIEAATQEDLFVAQGYVTAQDRLWQMDAFRRNANGELAEILGPSLVRHDKTQRVLQFRNTARRIYANLPAEDRARLDDYARGVNLFIAQHQDTLPAEFKLLMYRPQPWSGVDSLSIGMMMVEMLDTHFYTKLGRERIAADLIVLATGYQPQEQLVRKLFGEDIANRVGPIWGFGDGQELRNMYARTGQPGLWFIAGSLAQCRINSKYLALQIKAIEQGLLPRLAQAAEPDAAVA